MKIRTIRTETTTRTRTSRRKTTISNWCSKVTVRDISYRFLFIGGVFVKRYKNFNELLEKSPEAYKFYSGLSFEVQQMLEESANSIYSENELINYVDNFIPAQNM